MNFKSYLITDPKYFTNNKEIFSKKLFEVLQAHQVDFICFRDKESKNIEELAKVFLEIGRKFNIEKILINSHINLAIKLSFDGIHLNSQQFDLIQKAKNNKLFSIVSCHNFEELSLANQLKVDCVTYSPIFKSPNKGEEKGVENLENMIKLFPKLNIIALGGIVLQEQINQVKNSGSYGFASIRYFV